MEVTQSTFFELLPEIQRAIDSATFLSIDCEFTGLNTTSNINAYDTPQQYFEKVRKSSKDFLVIQFGLCVFRYVPETGGFKQKAYNFYIFPRPLNRIVPDHRFLCQASSIDFLINQGFDFNKLFKDGIPYLNTQCETKYRDILEEGRNARAKLYISPQTLNTISVPVEEKPFIDKVFEEIEDFIKSDKDEHILPKCNAFLRRLIYQTAQGRIDNRASLETRDLDSKDRVMIVTRPKSVEDRNKDEETKSKEEGEVLKQAIGFSSLVDYISKSRKMVIGHNMVLDVCHTIDKFLTSLPADYISFKECVHCLLPNIIDTKYMSNSAPFKELIPSSVLSELIGTVSSEPFGFPLIEPEDTPFYSLDDAKEHEAGYDAYITGLSFLSMWKYLGDEKQMSNPFEDISMLKPYINRLYLMRIQDAPYIQLDGPDSSPSRDHVFYLTFPNDWKLNDIVQLFSPFGNIFAAWINEQSAYIALHKRDQAAVALRTLSQSDTYSIMTYAQRQAVLSGLNAQAKHNALYDGLPPFKKRKSCSNIDTSKNAHVHTGLPKQIDISKRSLIHETIDTSVKCIIKPRKRTISKTFEEDNSWE